MSFSSISCFVYVSTGGPDMAEDMCLQERGEDLCQTAKAVVPQMHILDTVFSNQQYILWLYVFEGLIVK